MATVKTLKEMVTFPKGIPGFEQLKRYVLQQTDPQAPFYFLQAADAEEVEFLLVNPFVFYPDYEFELSDAVQSELSIAREEDVQIFCIVSAGNEMASATLNLMAPIVVNKKSGEAQQVILHQSPYQTKHPLFPEAQGGEG